MKIDLRGQLKGGRRADCLGLDPYAARIRDEIEEIDVEKARLTGELLRLDGKRAGLEQALDLFRGSNPRGPD